MEIMTYFYDFKNNGVTLFRAKFIPCSIKLYNIHCLTNHFINNPYYSSLGMEYKGTSDN